MIRMKSSKSAVFERSRTPVDRRWTSRGHRRWDATAAATNRAAGTGERGTDGRICYAQNSIDHRLAHTTRTKRIRIVILRGKYDAMKKTTKNKKMNRDIGRWIISIGLRRRRRTKKTGGGGGKIRQRDRGMSLYKQQGVKKLGTTTTTSIQRRLEKETLTSVPLCCFIEH